MRRFLIPAAVLACLILCELLDFPVWVGLLLLALICFLWHKQSAFWVGYFLHGSLGKPKLALRMYEIGWRRGGRAAAPLVDYAALLMQNGSYQQAMTVLEEEQNSASLTPAMNLICQQYLAIAYEKTGDVSRAIEVMEDVRSGQESLQSDFYATLAYFYLEADDIEKARAINALAYQEGFDNCAACDNEALLAYKTGETDRARELFQRELELDETLVSPQYYLGLIAQERGEKALAAEYFRKAHEGTVNGLSTVAREQIEEKYQLYQEKNYEYEI